MLRIGKRYSTSVIKRPSVAVQFVLPDSKSLSRPPSIAAYIVDRTFFVAAAMGALAIIALVGYILWGIGGQALPAIGKSGA